MKKFFNPLFAMAIVVVMSPGCVPGNVDGNSVDLLHAPGDSCTAGERAECMGGGSQQCDPATLTWGACTADAPCSPPAGLRQYPVDATAPCAPNEWRLCNTGGGTGLAGFQLCDTVGGWLECGACGVEVTQPMPPDAGPPPPCGGDPLLGATCTVAVGACVRSGTWLCEATTNTRYCDAMAGVSMTEICNNIDDDCNGVVDDNVTRSCYTGSAGTAGVGECLLGYQACTAGVWDTACTGEVTPVAEDCTGPLHDNGIDEDCSGSDLVCLDCGGDTSPGATCTTGRGACVATGTYVCEVPTGTMHCNAVAGDGTVEVCDGVDNDCNGLVDDNPADGSIPWVDTTCYTDASGTPLGGNPDLPGSLYRCQRGSRTCTVGSWGACAGAIGPIAEICDNGIDDDCDGHIDTLDVDCGAPVASDAGTPMTDAGSDAGVMSDSGTGGSDAGGGADSGSGGSDAGSGSGGNAAERAACESARLSRGWVGSHSVTMDLACLNSTLGTCATGWQLIVWDGLGCEVPSDQGVNMLTVASDNDAPGNLTRIGARCGGSGTGRPWSGPACTLPASQCVTAFASDGVSRLADGRIMDGGSGLLPTFPSNATGGTLTCP